MERIIFKHFQKECFKKKIVVQVAPSRRCHSKNISDENRAIYYFSSESTYFYILLAVAPHQILKAPPKFCLEELHLPEETDAPRG